MLAPNREPGVDDVVDEAAAFEGVAPQDALAQGGLTIYGAECGRFPVCPTVIVEW